MLSSRAGRFYEEMDTEPTTYGAETIETAGRDSISAEVLAMAARLVA